MFAKLRQLVVGFFIYNLVNVVVSFHVFVDVCVSVQIGQDISVQSLSNYEKAAAAFLFFEFLLSMLACVFAVKAVEEIKSTKGSEGNRGNIDMGLPM